MSNMHKGRVAVVTGGAKGIGRAVAVALAKQGASLVLLDIEEAAETAELVTKLGQQALAIKTDVTSPAAWDEAVRQVKAKFGRADILINNAGIYPFRHFHELDYTLWSQVMRINLDGAFLGTKAFVPLMVANKWGRIVSLTSSSIGNEMPGFSHYMASKMGVIGLTRGLANDLGRDGITANAVAPAVTNTPGTSITPDEIKASVWSRQPIPRFAEPDDIANPIVFLTSDEASFITGQTLVVDGGLFKL